MEHVKVGLLRTSFPSPPWRRSPPVPKKPLPKPSRIPAEYPPICRRFAPSPDPQITTSQVTTRQIQCQAWARSSRPKGYLGDIGKDSGYPDSCTSRPTGVPLPPAESRYNSNRIPLELTLNC